jgi:hypothetical protein
MASKQIPVYFSVLTVLALRPYKLSLIEFPHNAGPLANARCVRSATLETGYSMLYYPLPEGLDSLIKRLREQSVENIQT